MAVQLLNGVLRIGLVDSVIADEHGDSLVPGRLHDYGPINAGLPGIGDPRVPKASAPTKSAPFMLR